MAETQRKNLLRDLASAARREQETRVMSPARALRLGLARAAAQVLDLPLQVTGLKLTEVSLDALAGVLPDDMLLALLDGPDGARGAVGLDPAVVAALIEVQTMGAVGTQPVSDRRLTPTDAAMVAPWLDAALERVDVALDREAPVGGKDPGWLVGYRFGAMAEEPRALALALDSADFHMVRLTVDVALGRRTGEMLLLLPAAKPPEAPGKQARPVPQETFLSVPAELRVIAARLHLPLDRAGALKPGEILPLDGLLGAAELRAVDGTLAGVARLGRLGDHWAVRLGSGEDAAEAAEPAPPAALAELPAPKAAVKPLPDLPPFDSAPDTLPDLPPLDFDTGFEGEGSAAPLPDLPEIGNAGFE
ncbi:MAG: flagellar motor switch protein FliM [Rhodobacteraceae bacterium]|nr:MAG: flagellar motor switch protein FliM [Paracoccaceae bacterium]